MFALFGLSLACFSCALAFLIACLSVFYFECSQHVCLLSLFAFSHVFASFTCLFVVVWAFVFAVLIWFVSCSFRQVKEEDDSKETQKIPAVLLTHPLYLMGL